MRSRVTQDVSVYVNDQRVDLWPSKSILFLPFLRGRHESGEFVVVEPPHGKVVERKVCTEREARRRINDYKYSAKNLIDNVHE